jgi:rubrerythrin
MTVASLTRTLDEALLALLQGETDACLVCGEPVEGEEERVECSACGSVLEAAPREVIPGQMTLIDG